MTPEDLIRLILHRLEETGLSAAGASTRAVGNHYLIRNMQRRGGFPSFQALQSLCRVLGLEFYIGPPRDPSALPPEGAAADSEKDLEPPPWARRLRQQMRRDLTEALNGSDRPDFPDSPFRSGIHELSAAAGEGGGDLDESVAGYLAFTRHWLDSHPLFPPLCTVVCVRGDSMEPTLPDGSCILVDRRSREPRHGRIFAVKTKEGLTVKRLQRDAGGGLRLIGDNPACKPLPWPDRAEVVGEVMGAGKPM